MKKIYHIGILSLLLLTLSLVSTAKTFAAKEDESTEIVKVSGKITNSQGHKVVGAQVVITCQGNMLTTTTDNLGKYSVDYATHELCPDGSTITVSGSTNTESGANTGVPQEQNTNDDSAIINVVFGSTVAVPEFNLLTASIAILLSGGAYLLFKRKSSVLK